MSAITLRSTVVPTLWTWILRRRSFTFSATTELRGPKFGCGLAQCGACTVIVEGRAIRSCVTPVETVMEPRSPRWKGWAA
jgi:aerobic-type carbon monoxide dehydrogenase small subunit (CoxS/CutS family)